MRYLFVPTLVAFVALLSGSQTPSAFSAASTCALTHEQAPEIRGIRLGMSTEQLLSLFPEDGNRQRITQAIEESKGTDNYGGGRFDLRPEKGAPNPRLAGLNFIGVGFIDERVTSFHIAYAGPEWKTVDQFVAKLTESLRLPRSSWEPVDESKQWLKCDGFRVDAYAFRGSMESWVRVEDTSAYLVVEARRETAKEKARQAFKP